MRRRDPTMRWLRVVIGGIIGATLWAYPLWAEIAMKVLVVNPSETEVKEFRIHSPLPPEVKPEHVLEADGLTVEYDSQVGAYFLDGTVTLKPKESVSKRILLEDIWLIASERLSAVREESAEVMRKLAATSYEERGRLLADSINRRLTEIEASQDQAFLPPAQHITRYRENTKTLERVESDLVSLRQLMVMAALAPASQALLDGGTTADHQARGSLSIATTWRLIYIILGLLAFVSLSFFLLWQRQLKQQLAKQNLSMTVSLPAITHGKTNGHGSVPPRPNANVPPPPAISRL